MEILGVLLGLAIFVTLINISFYLRKLNDTAEKILKDRKK